MRRNIVLGAILAVLALVVPMTGHAFTTVASCSTSATAINACPVTFVCPVHTVNLRAEPAFAFVGIVDITLSDSFGNSFTHSSEWFTGRIQFDGPTWTTVQMEPFATCSLSATTADGSLGNPTTGSSLVRVEA
ncbi:MAG: hypothetical protein ACRDJM_02205 [Actinomycetota bacterium]